ncbi:MAG TPA: ATP-dependent DNA helicase RecG [Candidatus Eisenbacteria bacterium]
MATLNDPIRYLKGVGPEMARRLARLGVRSVRDLLFHVPTAYRDRRAVTPIARLAPGADASVLATVVESRLRARARGRRDLTATLRDDSGLLRAVWFNQPFRERLLTPGARYLFSGAVQAFHGLELHNPEFEPEEPAAGDHLHVGRMVPRYPLTEGIGERWIRARVRETLDGLPDLPDQVPEERRSRLGLPPLRRALEEVHFPPGPEAAEPARRRIALEEILRLQVSLQYARRRHRGRLRARSLADGEGAMRRLVASLPFAPTESQAAAIAAIAGDLDREEPMRRLLLGDVGSGKTVVALAAAARAAGAGAQAAILAPTAILAEQHARTAASVLAPLGIEAALLTASTPPAERARLLARIASGETAIVIGTHALLERDLAFRALGLVVVDEQHRFGVRQRITLAEKGAPGRAAHLLVLTATPIPRSLALTLYGDLDVSLLPEKPPGRAPIATSFLRGEDRGAVTDLLAREVGDGGSAFVVYPVVDESETLDLKAATAMAETLSRVPALAKAGVALVHGRLKAGERRAALDRFRSGRARVLVATTVVEVGLDVPDATLILIEHPERFGLAQLHQLRGRVGRAERPGRCVLAVGRGIGEMARKRLTLFRCVSDGFKLAEEDLRLRGPGEFLGTSQHGFPELRVARPLTDLDLIEAARSIAAELLDERERGEGVEHLREWIEAQFAGAERLLGSG